MRTVLSLLAAAALLLAVSGVASAAPLPINNPGFETGNFTGWNQWGDYAAGNFMDSDDPHTGSWDAEFEASDAESGITQDFDTVIGATYTISFWLNGGQAGDTSGDQIISMSFGSGEETLTDQPYAVWTPYSFTGTATAAVTTLSLGFQNNPAHYYLDDVSVDGPLGPTTPEPAAFALGGLGLLGLGLLRRRRA